MLIAKKIKKGLYVCMYGVAFFVVYTFKKDIFLVSYYLFSLIIGETNK